jgi:Kef-type K+ transport system membrane component KefB
VSEPDQTPPLRPRLALGYGLMLGVAILVFLFVRQLGGSVTAPAAPPLATHGTYSGASEALLHVLLALAVVLVVARLLGGVFKRLHQPPVIGEVIAGIMLGPSLLGRVAPEASQFLLPPNIAPFLGVIAQIGVILYMFIVGLELNTLLLHKRTHASVAVSHASIVLPFTLGSSLALWLYPRYSSSNVSFTVFALFMGVAMSVTAFPVLARILTDQRMHQTRMGTIALACAAVDDATAWCLLAFVVSVVQAEPGRILITVSLTGGYIAAMLFLVRPLVLRFVRWHETSRNLTQNAFAGVCVALLLSSLATELIGIHALFGAFLLGAIVPHDSALAREVMGKLEDLVIVLFLPAFFAFTGLRTQIGLVNTVEQWLTCLAIILVASIGKFGGSALAARITGMPWRESAALGVLMNTRGLMELIVLNVGLDLGVLSPVLFAMLVVMALVTTFATTPILNRVYRPEPPRLPDGELLGS